MKHLKASGVVLFIILSGCARFRAPHFTPPPNFSADPRAAQIVNSATRASAWETLCPAPPKLQFGGEITVSGRWWRGKQQFNTYYFAYHPRQDEPTLRFSGFKLELGTTLFDILVRDGRMTVLLPSQRAGFKGEIPKEGSPFRARFGVEPWQLNSIFLIGRSLAEGQFRETSEGGKQVLIPLAVQVKVTASAEQAAAESAAATFRNDPSRIELDRKTGLPLSATWRAGDQTYEVRYLAWDWFKNKNSEETGAATTPQLMPKQLQIHRAKPSTLLDLKIDHYQFGTEVPPKIFTMYTTEPLKMRPLSELNNVLQ